MAIMKKIILALLFFLIFLTIFNIYIACVIYADLIWPQKTLDLEFLIILLSWKIVLIIFYIMIIYLIFKYDKFFQMISPITITLIIALIVIGILQIFWIIADIQTEIMMFAVFEIFNPANYF